MSSLHDLRSTLEQHADELHDTERYVRPVAVRARVRAVRRRRAAGVAIAAALVLVAGVAGAASLRSPGSPQPASVVGVDVPRTIAVLGFPYALRESRALDGSTHLQPSDDDQAVVLVARGLGSGSATLYADGQAVARVRGDQHSAAPYPVGDGGTGLEVRFSGARPGARAGVAIYDATGDLADGATDGRSVFRYEYADEPLLGATFAEPGAASATFHATGAITAMRFVPYCEGAGDAWVHISIDGKGSMAGSCEGGGRDLAAGSSGTFEDPGPALDHVVEVYLTRSDRDGAPVAVPGARFGAAAYRSTPATEPGLGMRVAETVEYDGRTWHLDHVDRPRGAAVRVDTSDGDRLLGVVGRGRLDLTWTGGIDHGGSAGSMAGAGVGSTLSGVLLAGDSYQVRATGQQVRVLVYRPE